MTRQGLIIKGVGGEYTVVCDENVYICTARGVFRNRNITPFVGDYCEIDTEKKAILSIKPRTNILRRPPVANIDQVIVIMAAAQPDFSAGLLDRFLVIAAYENIDAVICINKYDLHSGLDIYTHYEKAGYPLIYTSVVSNIGLDKLTSIMEGKLNVFAGPSGAGKSSLINALIPGATMETGDISQKLKRGKHTTRHAEILKHGAGYIVDTPGFSSLEVDEIPMEPLGLCFPEFEPFFGKCKFNNCLHDAENNCAVKEQVGTIIHPGRYASYISFLKIIRASSTDSARRVRPLG